MKAFRFRLERLLGFAAAERRDSARQLGDAQDLLRRWEADWAAAGAGRRQAERDLSGSGGIAVRLPAWREREDDVAAGRRAEQRAAERVAEQREQVAGRQADYIAARRDERLLEAIRDRRRQRWQIETSRREQAAMDDLAQVTREFRRNQTPAAKGGDESGQGDSNHAR